ncbi:MAG: T9SS type A sorting domain-containing protein [Bacteroidales bacterium]|nr:T9SS type A sorting domain-containing protein [Bacteroidales bacterium]
MDKSIRFFLILAAMLLPFVSRAQVYVSDYAFSSSMGGYSSIAASGTQLTSLQGDDVSESLPLPFDFILGQDTCSSIMVSSNGQIGIGSANPAASGFDPHTSGMSIISPLGMDFDLDATSGGGQVYYEVQGYAPSRVVIVEYDHVRPYGESVTCSFQVCLHENGDVDFIYDTCTSSSNAQAYVFLGEQTGNHVLSAAGPWSSLVPSMVASPLSLGGTNVPAPGLTVSFLRIENYCLRPIDFTCTSFSQPDSVAFVWTPAMGTGSWELRFDTVGTPIDSMLHIEFVSDTFYVCTSMLAGGVYDVYLRTDCGTEFSGWEGPIQVTPGAYNLPTTGSYSIHACGGMIYDDGGPAGNYSHNANATLVIYPSSPDSIVLISGILNTESCCDHLYIYDGASASGALLYQGQGTSQIVPTIRSASGPLTIRFTSDGSVNNAGFELSVSCVAAPTCRYINAVEVSNVMGASALFSWDLVGANSYPAYYVVTLRNDDASEPLFIDTTSQLSYFFSGLNPTTHYTAYVCSICGTDTIAGDSASFFTRCLAGGVTPQSGNGTSLTTSVPVNSSWGNTFCQSIYTPADLNAMGLTAGPINGITYTWNTAGSYEKELVIHMGQTSVNSFSGYSPIASCLTEYYRGPRHTTDVGTIEYYFNTPFIWDGVSNVVVTSFVNQPAGASHSSSGFYAYSTSCGTNRTTWAYKDGTAYTTSNYTTNYSSTGVSTYRPNISFIRPCDTTATCAMPNVVVTQVLSDSVSIMWAPGFNETSWDLDYRMDSDTLWISAATGITDRAFTFAELIPMRTYYFRVTPDCGGDSIAAIVQATTSCVPLTDLPFSEDFENFVAASTSGSPITSCWHRGSNYTSSSYPYLSSSYASSGSKSMYMYAPGSSYYSYLALPAMADSLNTLSVSFSLYATSANRTLEVGAMTNPEDYSTFTSLATITTTATSRWDRYEVPLTAYTGQGQYIALAVSGSNYLYLDDLLVEHTSACPRPTDVTFSTITPTSATVHWVDTAASSFEIEYGPSGFNRGEGVSLFVLNEDSVSLYGLAHSSRYDVYVRAFCSVFDTSNWSFVQSFSTLCSAIDSLPYTEDFMSWGAGTGVRPDCWTCGGYSSYPYIQNVTNDQGSVTDRHLYFYSYSTTPTYASLPEVDSLSYPIETLHVYFDAWAPATTSTSYTHQVIVGVCSTPGDLSTFIPADTIQVTSTPTTYEASFASLVGAGRYITFVSTLGTSATGATIYYNTFNISRVVVDLLPSCQSPNRLSARNIATTSATLTWADREYPIAYQVEYGPAGFVRGTGTLLTTTSNPLVVTGLQPATPYEFIVRNICSESDTSEWAVASCQFSTMQVPATVPYFYDFETSNEWTNWQTNTNYPSINWYRDTAAGNGTNGFDATGRYSMFISADTGRTNSTNYNQIVNAAAYRDIDFGAADTAVRITFRAKAGGTTTAGYDGLAVFMVDSDAPVVASNQGITSPWGSIQEISYMAIVHVNTNWNTYTYTIDSIGGVHRLVFFWFNQATGTEAVVGQPGAVDDISIDYVQCPAPTNLRVARLGNVFADVAWFGDPNANYRVICRNQGTIVSNQTTTTNSIHLSDLDPDTRYTIQVRRVCSSEDSSRISDAFSFNTLACNGGTIDSLASSNSLTNVNLPVSNYYRYSYSQQIIPGSEIHGSGQLVALSFKYAHTAANSAKTSCSIYVAHTTLSSFSSVSDFVDPATFQLVYTGSLSCTQGWNRINFNYPFEYDGHSNLVIAVDDNSGSYNGDAYRFQVDQTNDITAISYYSDSDNPDASSATALSQFSGSRTSLSMRNQLKFEFCPANSCPNPILRAPIIRPASVTLRWYNTGERYQLSYRREATSSWIVNNITLTDTFFVIDNAYPNTEYVYRVRQYCDSADISNYALGTFNPSDVPCLSPMGLRLTEVTNKKATLYWNPEENNISYRLHVFNTAYDKVVNAYGAHASVNNLSAATTYYAAVQATCQNFDDPSEWSDTISFTTDFCPDVTDLTYSDLQGNSVVLDWVEGGRAEEWEVSWGPHGFNLGEGFSIFTDHHPYRLDQLCGETDYDIYVRAKCGDNFMSEHWSNAVRVVTPYSAIHSATDDFRVQLFPNPTSGDVELSLPSADGTVTITVVDLAGRTVITHQMPAGTEHVVLPTSQLSQGAYYVRVVSPSINTVKKLIVR